MASWTSNELEKIGKAEELQVAGLQEGGSLKKFVTIWVVRVGDELYVRSYKGRGSGWFTGVLVRHEGRIKAGGVEKDVTFEEITDPTLHRLIDAAYQQKYRRYDKSIVDTVLTPTAHVATLRLLPH